MAGRQRENPIPTEFKEAVYYLGLDHTEIVHARRISSVPVVFDVHLRKGGREWWGAIEAPPFGPHPPVTRLEDLINSTQDCAHCGGSGKVPKDVP